LCPIQLQFKQIQYQSQIIQSYIRNLETTLKAYNAGSTVSGDEQFLSITKLRLSSIQQKIQNDRMKEHRLKLSNHTLRCEINELKQQHDALREDIKSQELKARSNRNHKSIPAPKDNKSKVDRRSDKTGGDPKERMMVETALHIIKGAIVKVLEIPTARTTMSVHFSDRPFTGSITIGNCADGKLYKLDDAMKEQIERYSNDIIGQNVPCLIHRDLKREDAEKRFGDEMYDYYPVPSKVTVLNVLEIKGWNINCSNKTLCKTTGEVVALKVGKCKFNKNKKELTVYFTVGDAAKSEP